MGLKLRAVDLDDLSVISSMTQDALVPMDDMLYLPDQGSFIAAINRFCWEGVEEGPPYHRCHAGLRFDRVSAVRRKGVSRSEKTRILDLLAIAYAPDEEGQKSGPGRVMLSFADDAAVQLDVSELLCGLEDLGDPWPTHWKPEHTTADL